MLKIEAFGSTDVGLLRTVNEDYFDISERHRVYVVADGMGGHNHGEVASQIAVETILDFIADSCENDGTLPIGYDASLRRQSNQLKHSIRLAHDEVLKAIRRDTSLVGMGTTVVGAIQNGDTLTIAHVGDSRGYRMRDGHLELLTQDHTWVNEQVVAGYLSEEQAKSHPLKNVITRALGGDTEVLVDVLETRIRSNDLFLLCSDGLTAMLSDQEIHRLLASNGSLEEICRRLIADANARGGFDNVTVVLMRVVEVDQASDHGRAAAGRGLPVDDEGALASRDGETTVTIPTP